MTDDEICHRLADAIRYHIAEAKYRATLTWRARVWYSLRTLLKAPKVRVKRSYLGSYTIAYVGQLDTWVEDGGECVWVYHGLEVILDSADNPSPAKADLRNAVRELATFYGVLPNADARRAAVIAAVQSITR